MSTPSARISMSRSMYVSTCLGEPSVFANKDGIPPLHGRRLDTEKRFAKAGIGNRGDEERDGFRLARK